MKTYIIHYKKLTDRREYLESELVNFNPIFIDEFDRDTLNLEHSKIVYNSELWEERTNNLYSTNQPKRIIKNSEICNSLSHLKALKYISDGDDDYGLILEDDVIVEDNFKEKLDDFLERVPKNFDVMFFGSSFSIQLLDRANFSVSTEISNRIYLKNPGKTRTVDGYIVSKKCATKIVNFLTEIALPFDFELNYVFKELNSVVYWLDPGIIKQGSQIGKYKSSIR